jgi:hypothetical protein
VAVSKQERAQQWLDNALDQFPVKVRCANCGETIGRYRPGRVAMPSLARPAVNFKCTRTGCRTASVIVLGETIE